MEEVGEEGPGLAAGQSCREQGRQRHQRSRERTQVCVGRCRKQRTRSKGNRVNLDTKPRAPRKMFRWPGFGAETPHKTRWSDKPSVPV